MLDTAGPELQISNKSGDAVDLKADNYVTITSDTSKELSAEVFPIDYAELAKVYNLSIIANHGVRTKLRLNLKLCNLTCFSNCS